MPLFDGGFILLFGRGLFLLWCRDKAAFLFHFEVSKLQAEVENSEVIAGEKRTNKDRLGEDEDRGNGV